MSTSLCGTGHVTCISPTVMQHRSFERTFSIVALVICAVHIKELPGIPIWQQATYTTEHRPSVCCCHCSVRPTH